MKLPSGAVFSKKQVLEIIGAYVRLDKLKSSCGKRLISWYKQQNAR